jgi:hypothetical protein
VTGHSHFPGHLDVGHKKGLKSELYFDERPGRKHALLVWAVSILLLYWDVPQRSCGRLCLDYRSSNVHGDSWLQKLVVTNEMISLATECNTWRNRNAVIAVTLSRKWAEKWYYYCYYLYCHHGKKEQSPLRRPCPEGESVTTSISYATSSSSSRSSKTKIGTKTPNK